MRRVALLIVILSALVPAADAAAGCFATAGLAPPPAGLGPGDTWTAVITVKQHGVRPIPDAKPTLTTIAADGARTEFAATPTKTPGVYEAAVVFPAAGSWDYEVNDGFVSKNGGQSWDCSTDHTFASVTIGTIDPAGPSAAGPPAAGPSDDGGTSSLLVALALAGIALAAAVAVVSVVWRLGRPHASA